MKETIAQLLTLIKLHKFEKVSEKLLMDNKILCELRTNMDSTQYVIFSIFKHTQQYPDARVELLNVLHEIDQSFIRFETFEVGPIFQPRGRPHRTAIYFAVTENQPIQLIEELMSWGIPKKNSDSVYDYLYFALNKNIEMARFLLLESGVDSSTLKSLIGFLCDSENKAVLIQLMDVIDICYVQIDYQGLDYLLTKKKEVQKYKAKYDIFQDSVEKILSRLSCFSLKQKDFFTLLKSHDENEVESLLKCIGPRLDEKTKSTIASEVCQKNAIKAIIFYIKINLIDANTEITIESTKMTVLQFALTSGKKSKDLLIDAIFKAQKKEVEHYYLQGCQEPNKSMTLKFDSSIKDASLEKPLLEKTESSEVAENNKKRSIFPSWF